MTKRRVAILGGGQAGLTAALQLTDPRNPAAAETEVTIYQLGWRLGGKGATGRPANPPARILEHGLHNWFGFYDNSVRQIRTVYDELGRPPGAPLATFAEAFEPANQAIFVEWIDGKPLLWPVTNPDNDATPGEGGLWLTPLEYIAMAIEAIEGQLRTSSLADHGSEDDHVLARLHALLDPIDLDEASAARAHHLLKAAASIARRAAEGTPHPIAGVLDRLKDEVERELPDDAAVPDWVRGIEDAALRPLCWTLWLFMAVLWRAVRDGIATTARTDERRLWIEANLAYACVVGAVGDRVIADGFDVVNDVDFRAWLAKHAYPDEDMLVNSPVVEAVYSGSFAYPRGDTHGGLDFAPAESLEAGIALRGIVRSLFTYKGSFAYRFTAGTADTCYAPTYEVLRARGVDVRFFSRVERLELGEGGVARVHVAEQAPVVGGGPYAPLVDVDGLPCWPLEPQWDQLVDGVWFRDEPADFEWPSEAVRARERPFAIEAGRDYDDVILAISIAALPPICAELIAADPAWAAAVEKVETVRTQALQVWLAKSPAELGFAVAGRPICGWRYTEESPLNVWGDFTELVPMEHWSPDGTPVSLGYFCSTMPDDAPTDPLPDQAAANARVRANALELLRHGVPVLLPGVLDAAGEFRWDLLVDPRSPPGEGPDRLDAQWIRGNVLATERYVLSVVGSSRHRLPAHDPAGPANLYLAGDWTACTINAGCMEAATISGMLCSNALCGYPPRAAIVGVDF
ncbi:MAG TPA: NAD(P)-binding protein [Solirubrobacteraceae bacterium]|nr:NAD(P)-binding protein [Solirubrobacteraceae bacterium]